MFHAGIRHGSGVGCENRRAMRNIPGNLTYRTLSVQSYWTGTCSGGRLEMQRMSVTGPNPQRGVIE